VAGRYANLSVLDVASVDELLSTLPMFLFLDITVTPLGRHPSALDKAEKKMPQ
jgi:muconolactone D-isomerase